MRTYKRTPKISDNSSAVSSINKTTKFNNQMTFTGINTDTNIYNVDQNSQTEAINVYVDEEMSLISREPLIEDVLPSELVTQGRELIDFKETNGVKIFVQRTTVNDYYVTAIKGNTVRTITCYNKYQLTVFNQYVICFRTDGAQVIDTTKTDSDFVWYPISDQSVVPITKITTGPDIIEPQNNQFSTKYIERYIKTSTINTYLPDGDFLNNYSRSDFTAKTQSNTYSLTDVQKPWKYPSERLFYKSSEFFANEIDNRTNYSYLITYVNKILAVPGLLNLFLSYDDGKTFISVPYPFDTNGSGIIQAGLDTSGRYFYCVEAYKDPSVTVYTNWKVWRYTISDNTWYDFSEIKNAEAVLGPKIHFFENDNIAIIPGSTSVYILNSGETNSWYKLDYPNSTQLSYIMGMSVKYDSQYIQIAMFGKNSSGAKLYFAVVDRSSFTAKGSIIRNFNGTYTGDVLEPLQNIIDFNIAINENSISTTNITIEYLDQNKYFTYSQENDETGTKTTIFSAYDYDITQTISSATKISDDKYIITTSNNITDTEDLFYLLVKGVTADALYELIIAGERVAVGGKYSHSIYNKGKLLLIDSGDFKQGQDNPTWKTFLYSNTIQEGDSFEIDYVFETGAVFSDVPNLSYSGSELYLAFDNELKITSNEKDGSNIKFYLPKINNQSFPNTITNLLNISTTELAVFFENGILIATKGTSETLGTVYSYAKTRLSLGVRLGDDVINTLDGANSIFPTIRGLAIMNYQAYMATTDQVLSFVTDKLGDYWDSFYAKGNIKILQMKDYIFISNQTNEYLMLDTRNVSWWLFRIPVNITRFLTNQQNLQIISKKLYKFDKDYDKNKYVDFDGSRIDWSLTSQRLHFGLPNHYKNLKQIIFQLMQSSDFKNTINTRIKLYRKVVTYREPDIVDFKIDEYRTFVKRFNYWKINELQWTLSNDPTTAAPAQLIVSGIDIKYEIGEEVR